MRIIDFHTHIFPDSVADTAVPFLENKGGIKSDHPATRSSLLASMEKAGISASVAISIATKPSQFSSILEFCRSIQSEKIIPFPSVHPGDPDILSHIETIAEAGMKGIKMHPYYQQFRLDDPTMIPAYKKMAAMDLILLSHTGFDMGYPRDRIADPEKVLRVLNQVPELKLVTSHFGGWEDWDEVERCLLGKEIYMEISYSYRKGLPREQALEFFRRHPEEYILFGTDSPWHSQQEAVKNIRELELGDDLLDHLFYRNAASLLDMES